MSRRSRHVRLVLLALAIKAMLVGVLLEWPAPAQAPAPALQLAVIGADTGHGNLLGVQAWLTPADYATTERLHRRLAGWLDEAATRGWLGERTVVVFPEHIGTWLIAAEESGLVHLAPSSLVAMPLIAMRHPFATAHAWRQSAESERATSALIRARAASMALAYQEVFARLARRHRVTIVAGSIMLPEPRLEAGSIVAGDGPLYNTSAVFAPDGAALALVRKVYPIGTELPFTAGAGAAEVPVIATPAGRLGVLVCADSWYPDTWDRLREQGVELVAVPSYATANASWDTPWGGYAGADAPADVDRADIGRLHEGEAWRRYALPGRLAASGARAGINVFLRGELWDLGDDGATLSVPAANEPAQPYDGPALSNVWIP